MLGASLYKVVSLYIRGNYLPFGSKGHSVLFLYFLNFKYSVQKTSQQKCHTGETKNMKYPKVISLSKTRYNINYIQLTIAL